MYLFIIFVLVLIVPLVTMPHYMKAGELSPYAIVFQGAFNTWIPAVVVMMFASFTGQDILKHLREYTALIIDTAVNDPSITGMTAFSGMSTAELTELLSTVYNGMLITLPAFIIIAAVISAYAEYILLCRLLRKHSTVRRLAGFREFSLPRNSITGVFLIYLASWLISGSGSDFGIAVYANMSCIFDFTFSLQGISVIFMFAHMKRIPKPVAVIAVILIWGNYIGKMLLVMLGLIDLMFGIKGRIKGSNGGIKL